MPNSGEAASSSTRRRSTSAMTGRRMTPLRHAAQMPTVLPLARLHETASEVRQLEPVDAGPSRLEHRGQQRERREHGRGHHEDRAGAEADEDVGRHDEHAESASTTVMPLKNTARPAVPLAAATASIGRASVGELLAEARHDEQRVVDAHRQAHHGDHVDREDRDAETWPSSAVSASARTMASTARKIGRPAATTVPNTTAG